MQFQTLREFLKPKLEFISGIILFIAAVLALVLDNTPWRTYYEAFFNTPFIIQFGHLHCTKPLSLWINDGLMTVFFLSVGLEIKREMFEGELNSLNKALLPAVAGLGGMVLPALIYTAFNWGDFISLQGWAIPAATDIAFSLGILSLLGSRLPISLKIFLTALAVFDDIGAILIIAIFYTHHIAFVFLMCAILLLLLLFLLNRLHVTIVTPYVLLGIVLWFCVLKSGVHATLSGIALAFSIPIRGRKKTELSPLRSLEHKLHPWVAFGVLPVFAFANAGVSFSGIGLSNLFSPVTWGIALGLFLGKQIGICSASWVCVKSGWASIPDGGNWGSLYGISLLAGVGFTMSLFIGTLAFGSFEQHYPAMVRLGVIIGSFIAGTLGYLVLRFTTSRSQHL